MIVELNPLKWFRRPEPLPDPHAIVRELMKDPGPLPNHPPFAVAPEAVQVLPQLAAQKEAIMSTTPVVATPAPAAKKSPFGFASIGHFFASAFGELKKATQYAEAVVLPKVQKLDETSEVYTAAAIPFIPQASSALVIERALDSAAGELLAAVHTADVAEGSSFVNVQLDTATVVSFKQFIADQKEALAKLGYAL